MSKNNGYCLKKSFMHMAFPMIDIRRIENLLSRE